MLKRFLVTIVISYTVLMTACQHNADVEAMTEIARFNFANGSSISDGSYEDYNPVMVQMANGKLVLVFISNRPCAAFCSGDTIFFTTSITAYANDGKLPVFNPLNVLLDNTNAVVISRPTRIAVAVSGNQINIYWRGTGNITESNWFTPPTADQSAGSPPPDMAANGTGCRASNILGIDASGNMISVAGTNAISRYNPANYSGDCNAINMFSNTSLSSALRLSVMRSASIGISEGFLVTEAGGILSAQTATSKGPQIKSFTDGLSAQGLTLTSASVLNANQSTGDLLVFSASAGAGKPSDLYILANKTPAELWLKYVRYGNQPTP